MNTILVGVLLIVYLFASSILYRVCLIQKKAKMLCLLPKLLTHEWVAGRELRAKYVENGLSIGVVNFYNIMREFTKENVVLAKDREELVDGEVFRERFYRIQ